MNRVGELPFGARCLVIPGRQHDPDGFFLLGAAQRVDSEVDPMVYVSAEGIRAHARDLGMLDVEAAEEMAGAIHELTERVAELEAEAVDMDRRWKAIDLLESSDFTARKKKGRPTEEAV